MNAGNVLSACQQFRLADLTRRAGGNTGAYSGAGVGASVEFHDFRAYAPGDDLRRVDWAVYGRTGELTMRRYREDVHPRCDVLVDGSRSMDLSDGRKGALVRELAQFFASSTRASGATARLHEWGVSCLPVQQAEGFSFSADRCSLFENGMAAAIPNRGLRVVISDFMHPNVPVARLRQLAVRGAAMVVVRVLGPWEANPATGEQWHMVDAEIDDTLTLGLTDHTQKNYLKRINRIRETLVSACTSCGAYFVDVCADTDLVHALARDFLPRQVVVTQ